MVGQRYAITLVKLSSYRPKVPVAWTTPMQCHSLDNLDKIIEFTVSINRGFGDTTGYDIACVETYDASRSPSKSERKWLRKKAGDIYGFEERDEPFWAATMNHVWWELGR